MVRARFMFYMGSVCGYTRPRDVDLATAEQSILQPDKDTAATIRDLSTFLPFIMTNILLKNINLQVNFMTASICFHSNLYLILQFQGRHNHVGGLSLLTRRVAVSNSLQALQTSLQGFHFPIRT